MQYFVALNLNRDCKEYIPGDMIDMPEDVAQDLLDAGVLSTEKVEAAATDVTPEVQQQAAQPKVGGAVATSGEPSLDGANEVAPSTTPATDVTPALEDMTRAELNALAAEKGIAEADFVAAPNKAAVIDLIKSGASSEKIDPSANL